MGCTGNSLLDMTKPCTWELSEAMVTWERPAQDEALPAFHNEEGLTRTHPSPSIYRQFGVLWGWKAHGGQVVYRRGTKWEEGINDRKWETRETMSNTIKRHKLTLPSSGMKPPISLVECIIEHCRVAWTYNPNIQIPNRTFTGFLSLSSLTPSNTPCFLSLCLEYRRAG